jgi:hypothetical protein
MKLAARLLLTPPLVGALLFAGACGDPLPDPSDTVSASAALTKASAADLADATARTGTTTGTTTATATTSATSIKTGSTIATTGTGVISQPPVVADPVAPQVLALDSGANWRRVQVSGTAEDAATGTMQAVSGEYYVFNGRDAIAGSSLPANTRAVLTSKYSTMPRPVDGEEEVIVVPKAVNDAIQSNVAYFSLCDDSNNQTFSKSYAFDKQFDYHQNSEPGALVGSGDFHTQLKGAVTGEVKYSIKYHYCLPTFVFHRMTVRGDADVLARATLAAQFQKKWSFAKEVAAPVLGTVSFFGIPVTFKAPISVGLDAQAAASFSFDGTYQAHGSFNISCTGSGCDGSKTATSGFTSGGAPSVAATARVKVTPWAEGAIRAYVLDEGIVSAQVGVRAKLPGDLWGYTGNTCGDADHDGANEYVSGYALDLSVGIDVVAKATLLGSNVGGPWSWNVWNKHLAFWSGGDAVAPIFYGKGCGGTNTATMHVAMRPCWPYTDKVNYQMTWGDGTTGTFSSAPGTMVTQAHAFSSAGAKSVRVDAVTDAAGRTLSGNATRTVNVNWVAPVCFDDLVLAQ